MGELPRELGGTRQIPALARLVEEDTPNDLAAACKVSLRRNVLHVWHCLRGDTSCLHVH